MGTLEKIAYKFEAPPHLAFMFEQRPMALQGFEKLTQEMKSPVGRMQSLQGKRTLQVDIKANPDNGSFALNILSQISDGLSYQLTGRASREGFYLSDYLFKVNIHPARFAEMRAVVDHFYGASSLSGGEISKAFFHGVMRELGFNPTGASTDPCVVYNGFGELRRLVNADQSLEFGFHLYEPPNKQRVMLEIFRQMMTGAGLTFSELTSTTF